MIPARSTEVDAIRSFALFGICVVNMLYLAMPLATQLSPSPTPVDFAARMFIDVFLQGKFFVLFSFLFGWGFGVQLAAAEQHGLRPLPRYRARLIGLFMIGLLHAVLVFAVDILMLYAVLGSLLWFLRDKPPRHLVRFALLATAVSAIALMALAILFVMLSKAPPEPAAGPGFLGGFSEATSARILMLPLSIQIVVLFNGPMAFAAFCAGLAAWKTGFFLPGKPSFGRLARNLPLLALAGFAGSLTSAVAAHGMMGQGPSALFGYASLAIGGPALAAAYLVIMVKVIRSGRLPTAFDSVGRMSLTAYVLQGVVAGLVFNGYGLGLYGHFGPAAVLGIAIMVFTFVHLACLLWLRFSPQGPLERLLRSFIAILAPVQSAHAR